ncbi:Heterokaryon incompatibility protein 6, OR allele [Cytospora mali]|uniref:Heterokaryon incompatibility protein 6, OR allele n=1 Tax=Cytospora mali TaxID=578113 RepID=A0A194UNS6_CYTMA|nr:Heterokaryon incompatibility protein 6, OR allele [Valsa mali var. pyri (nom. inval.)]
MEDHNYLRDPNVSLDGTAHRHGADSIPDPEDDDFHVGPAGEPEFDSHNGNSSRHEDTEDIDAPGRPYSSASHSMQSFEGDGTESHRGTEDDVFSDRSPRSSIHSADEHCGQDGIEDMTEKGNLSPDVRSRVTSGVSMSGASAVSDLSRYEKEDFVPTSRSSRPAFRSPSSVRAMQMSSPTPSIYSSSTHSGKRQNGLPTISRVGSPSASAQYSSRGRSTPSRFRRAEPAPLVLLHVTLLPPRWVYGDVVNHFESRKIQPIAFSGEGMKNLRSAWRQLQDRLGDTEMERGILLPHPQNDYEVLEERLLEALELPLRRRARILECGHYLGPSNEMTLNDDIEDDFDDFSDDEREAVVKKEKRHWCKSCKGDIKYQELGSERVFRMKVYASNGLMSAGAWEACWREMERVDIEVEPIIDSAVQSDLARLAALFEQDQRKQLDQQSEEGQRRQRFEEERQSLEAQRRQFEEQRQQLENQRRSIEDEQHQHLEDARRQELVEEHRILDQQRQQLEEARQQFEEERRHRLEEEELRRLQREEDEQKFSSRSMSRASYAEDDLASPAPEATASKDIDGRRRDHDRLREIYGDHSRASSEGVDSGRQREEEQKSQQFDTSSAYQESGEYSGQTETETQHPESYSPQPTQPAYQQHDDRRRSLVNASLPELLGETIRVVLQEPKNVAIAVLVLLLAMLAGQFSRPDERGVELYQPQQQTSYEHHQLEGREPVAQLGMGTTPAMQYLEPTSTPSQLVETVYKTVPSRVVETIYTTVTESLVGPLAQSTTKASDDTEATEVASELTPSSADPSVDLTPDMPSLPFCWWDDEEIHRNSSSYLVVEDGFDAFTTSEEVEIDTEVNAEVDTEVDHINTSIFNPTCSVDGEEQIFKAAQFEEEVENKFNTDLTSPDANSNEPEAAATTIFLQRKGTDRREAARTTASTTFSIPTPQTSPVSMAASPTKEKRTLRVRETVTETVLVTATRTRSALEMRMTSRRTMPEHDEALEEFDDTMDNEDEVLRETVIETVKVTSTVEVDWPENTCGAFGPYTPAVGIEDNFKFTVSCEIREASFDDRVKYEALSYAWGSKTPGHSISVGDKTLAVTPNCLEALRHLRARFRRRVLWVDAVCIDQREGRQSTRERNHQVRYMGEIYSKAKTVIVWLGASDSTTARTIRRLKMISRTALPLWGRADMKVPFTMLQQRLLCKALADSKQVAERLYHRYMYEANKPYRIQKRLFFRKSETAKTLLTGAFSLNATLPVDRIYALYSLLLMCDLPLPEPDYNKAFEVVFEETVWAWIQSRQDLSILQTAARPTHIKNLPSWVPAYHLGHESFVVETEHLSINAPLHRIACRYFSWDTFIPTTYSMPSTHSIEVEHCLKTLRVKGRYIGQVTFSRGDTRFSYEHFTAKQQDWCRHVHEENIAREPSSYDNALRDMFETITWASHGNLEIPEGHDSCFSAFKTWFEVMIAAPDPEGLQAAMLSAKTSQTADRGQAYGRQKKVEAAFKWMEYSLFGLGFHAFCVLDNGMMAMANYWCEVGDEVFLLRGADCPFVLRREGESYRLVGPTYVHRLYQARPWRFDGHDVRDITLV